MPPRLLLRPSLEVRNLRHEYTVELLVASCLASIFPCIVVRGLRFEQRLFCGLALLRGMVRILKPMQEWFRGNLAEQDKASVVTHAV